MKKIVKVLLATTLCVTVVSGCKKEASATYAKAGLGVISTYADGQVNTTFAAVGLDKDGTIQYVDLDTAQSTPADEAKAKSMTKEELETEYGMAGNSSIGKDWHEQSAAFEEYCVGKTVEELKAMELNEGKPTDADLTAGCTIKVNGYIEVIEKAVNNAVEVEAEQILLGRAMANNAEKGQLVTDIVLFALDADEKVAYAKWDVAQISESNVLTKGELGADYGMAGMSGIKKEWHEQAKAFEDFCIGKTLQDVKLMELTDGKPADADLSAGCTISVSGALAAIIKAK